MAKWLTCLLLIFAIPNALSVITKDQINNIWSKMGEKWDTWWELWSGLGICNNGESLISEIPNNSCLRQKCLLSWTSSSLIDLDLLISSENYKYEGTILKCSLPSGGQARSKDSNQQNRKEVSFIMTLGNNDEQASLSILELYRTAHEVKSGEFIFIKKLGSPELPKTFRLIENLEKLFNADIKLLVQSVSGNTLRVNSNDAIYHAKGEYIALLDDSIIVTPSWISLLLSTLKSPPFNVNIGMIGPLLVTPNGKVSESGGLLYDDLFNYTTGAGAEPNKLTNFQARIVDFLNSKCVLFKKELFQNSPIFDHKYLTDYGRDVNVALSLLKKGYVTFLQPLSVAIYDSESSPLFSSSELLQDITHLKQNMINSIQLCPYRGTTCSQSLPSNKFHDMISFYRQSNRILVLDLIPPEPDKDAGSIRLQEMFRIFHKLGYQISFQPNSTGRHVKYALQLLYQGIQYLYPGTLRQLSKYIQKYSPKSELFQCPWKVIIACRRSVIDKQINHIKKLCPNVPLIFDTVDVHFIREQRSFYRDLEQQKLLLNGSLTATQQQQGGVVPKDLKKDYITLSENTVREVLLMLISNITYVVSSSEYETLHSLLPTLDLRIVSNIYNPPDKLPLEDPIKRTGALFVGSMCHPPNIDALHFIADEIFTFNRTFPNGFLCHIVVSRSQECPQIDALTKIQKNPLIRLYYDVTNEFLDELHSRVKVVLAPVLVGAGVKGKVNYALLHGVPVISTSIGAEGMYLESRKSFLLANTGIEFYHGILELYQNHELWQTLRNGGLEVMKNHFSRNVATNVIIQSFNKLNISSNENRLQWQCPIVLLSSCSSIISSDQLLLPLTPYDNKVSLQQLPNEKQEYFQLNMRYPNIRTWRTDIMKLFNISLPY